MNLCQNGAKPGDGLVEGRGVGSWLPPQPWPPGILALTAGCARWPFRARFRTVVIISIPVALLVLFAQRRIVAGLTAGSFR
jgi:hypothetical protein